MFLDSPSSVVLIVTALLCVAFGFFSMCQVVLFRASRRNIEEQHGAWALAAVELLDNVGPYIVICQVAKVVIGLMFGSAVVPAVHLELAGLLSSAPDPQWGVDFVAWIASFLGTAAGLLFVHQVARALGSTIPDSILVAVTPLLRWSKRVLYPAIMAINWFVERLMRLGGLSPVPTAVEHIVSVDQLTDIVERSSDAGQLGSSESEIIQGVIDISDTPVSQVMTPRTDIVTVQLSAGLDALRELFTRHKLSRVLVVGDTVDDVHGVVLARDLLPFIGVAAMTFSLQPYVRPVKFVPNTLSVKKLFHDFQMRGVHFAVVHDEHGGVDGIVTFEDLLEEIVGEIHDEYDIPAEETSIEPVGEGEFLVGGSLPLTKLEEGCGIQLPEGEYSTVAGFLMRHFNRIPGVGEHLTLSGLYLEVVQRRRSRVAKVRIKILQPEQAVPVATTNDTDADVSLPHAGKAATGG